MASSKHLSVFEATLQKSNEILKAMEERFRWMDRHKSYLAFRAVTHALRDRLPAEVAASFAAQLPMLLKGVFYDGWRPASAPVKMKRDEFVSEVEVVLNPPPEEDIEEIIRGVVNILAAYTDPGEVKKIKKVLPKDIVKMLD